MFCSLTDSTVQSEQKFHSGDKTYRLSGDVSIVSECISYTFPILAYSIIQYIATWIYLMSIHSTLTVILGSIAPIIIIIGFFYTRRLIPISKNIRQEGSKVNEYIQEHLQHNELITAIDQNKYIQYKTKKLQNDFLRVIKSKIRLTIEADSLSEAGFSIGYLSIIICGIYGIENNTVSYGELLVFIQLIGQLQRPLFIIKDQYPSIVDSFASIERLIEISSLPKETRNNKTKLDSPIGIRFCNVAFRYPGSDKQIFEGFNFDFKPGSITAISGETGVGKSSLVKMILAILSPDKGIVEIYNNTGEKHQVSPSTRCNCAYVPQGNSLISGTIKYNLLLGNLKATESQMKEALHYASADFVFKDFPNGLETIVGEKGLGISEGQAQRIAIARSLLHDGGLVILDEPTSALDANTEEEFLNRLVEKSKNKTLIIITHKPRVYNHVTNILTLHSIRHTSKNKTTK